ncbi:MBL fold metallo-hydrolase [Halopenitus sp. POP-27]|uniref:MBL fold metallo-hydrolase n=1 Tax=Halopenitus sp. POP-27 TaxID=2994425 RepID=UPI00246825EA|nr:MBL fold metallo-hydrolase [Halopenitus sp. POP-27]
MEVTILGSGSPLAQTSRGGQSIVVTVDDEPLLFDCGPMSVERLLDNEFKLRNVTNLFLTHHHMDHNASFFHFAILSWMYGRRDLTVYGPDGTDALIDALGDIYEADIGYREKFGRPVEGISEIGFSTISADSRVSTDDWTVSTHSVDHSIETYAYRIENADGSTVVYAPDTSKIGSLSDFAADADVLIHDAAVGPEREPTDANTTADTESWKQFQATNPKPEDTPIVDVHTSAREAAEIADAANVGTLVLTHFLPFRDTAAMRSTATDVFSGTVRIAEDGLTVSA